MHDAWSGSDHPDRPVFSVFSIWIHSGPVLSNHNIEVDLMLVLVSKSEPGLNIKFQLQYICVCYNKNKHISQVCDIL